MKRNQLNCALTFSATAHMLFEYIHSLVSISLGLSAIVY